MNKRLFFYGFIWLFFLLILLSFPQAIRTSLRQKCLDYALPLYQWLHTPSPPSEERETSLQFSALQEQCYELERENRFLKAEWEQLMALYIHSAIENKKPSSPFLQRRLDEQNDLLSLYEMSLPAQVFLRSSERWKSFVHINVGKATNRRFAEKIVQKSSPVILGNKIVGVIEEVGERESLVRLITDPNLKISVRTAREYFPLFYAQKHAIYLLETLPLVPQMLFPLQERASLTGALQNYLEKSLLSTKKARGFLLAKGELFGSTPPLSRFQTPSLKGIGFQYDYADEEGEECDLRKGKKLGQGNENIPLICKGDLLISTGMDGIFPAGLWVGTVKELSPLKESSMSYEIEAEPAIANIHWLSHVTVLPPLVTH